MKQILLMITVVTLVGCGEQGLSKAESAKVIEAAIRKKLTGELTKADFEKVNELNLYNNKLANVRVLVHLTQLTELNLSSNLLTDVMGLEKLTNLTSLSLGSNQLTDVKGLEKLMKLEVLWIGENRLTNVKELEKFTQLRELNLRNNPDLTKAQIAELQKALPKCQIFSNATK